MCAYSLTAIINIAAVCGLRSANVDVTFGDGPPGQRDVGEVRVERHTLRALPLLPQMEGLSEPAHRPHRVVQPVVQLCNDKRRLLSLLPKLELYAKGVSKIDTGRGIEVVT